MQDNTEYYEEGTITIINGPQRSGKTLVMSIFALDRYVKLKKKVLTNIAYEDPITKQVRIPYQPLNFFELTMGHISDFINRCITIDELNFYLDSRGSMTKINRRFCQWLLQSKKMGITTYGTTHNLGYLDLRFRENFDWLIEPRMIYKIIPYTTEQGNVIDKKVPVALVLNKTNGPNQKQYRRTITIDFIKNPKLLGMYNTRNVFNPFQQIEEQMEKEKLEKKQARQTPLHKQIPSFMT